MHKWPYYRQFHLDDEAQDDDDDATFAVEFLDDLEAAWLVPRRNICVIQHTFPVVDGLRSRPYKLNSSVKL